MKQYFNIFIPIILILISTNVYCSELKILIDKVGVFYQGEPSPRIYSLIKKKEMTFDPSNSSAQYGPAPIAILADVSDGLPSGIIMGIKFKGGMGPSHGWMRQNGAVSDSFGDGYNFLGAPIDLSTIKRKKVTVKFYGNGENPALLIATTPGDKPL